MAEVIRLGRMTDTMDEGFIAELNIKVGDTIKSGDTIAEVETDKATLPLESYQQGKVLHIAAKKGDTLKIGDLIAIIGKEGEDISALLSHDKPTPVEVAEKNTPIEPAVTKAVAIEQKVETIAESSGGRVKASPLAKTIAREKGIDLTAVKGSGEDGRIVKRDLESISTQTVQPVAVVGKESFREVRNSQMRKTIAKRLSESKYSAPHFYLTMEINMQNAVDLRGQLNNVLPQKVSFNDIVLKAVASALRANPAVNCSWLGDTIRYNDHIHIGMAVAVEEGLLVPVIKFADNKTISQLSAEARQLAEKASAKKLLPTDMEGNTFTISNLGMFGIEEFTAIINPPDACILAVGAIQKKPGVVGDEIKPVHTMKVTLSCDHRAVDGANGAKFLQTLKQLLENPVSLLL